jgi:hypothetical protein
MDNLGSGPQPVMDNPFTGLMDGQFLTRYMIKPLSCTRQTRMNISGLCVVMVWAGLYAGGRQLWLGGVGHRWQGVIFFRLLNGEGCSGIRAHLRRVYSRVVIHLHTL